MGGAEEGGDGVREGGWGKKDCGEGVGQARGGRSGGRVGGEGYGELVLGGVAEGRWGEKGGLRQERASGRGGDERSGEERGQEGEPVGHGRKADGSSNIFTRT